ncbi:MAG: signal peptidase I [Thermoleophilaceae bacterium]|nr:signal peptidase I [Thermoleophilaceae bacterium]
MVAALLALVALAGMVLAGYKPEVIVSGSMEPKFFRGTLIFVRPTPAAQLRKGDIITFQNPYKPDHHFVTHRIDAVEQSPQGRAFRTRGDNNQSQDPWLLQVDHEAGLYAYDVPYVGKLSFLVHSRLGYLLLCGLPILLLAFVLLVKVWTVPSVKPTAAGGLPA